MRPETTGHRFLHRRIPTQQLFCRLRLIGWVALVGLSLLGSSTLWAEEAQHRQRTDKTNLTGNSFVYRSVAVTPDYQGGQLAGVYVQVQDQADQPVTGRWPIMLTLLCDSGCTGPGQHANPSEVAFANGGYFFLGLTNVDGARYISLTTAAIGAGINITSQVLADNTALMSPLRSRYAEVLAGAGLHVDDGEPVDER